MFSRRPDHATQVRRRLTRLERQGERSAGADHGFAGLLIATIAAAALIGISGADVEAILSGHVRAVDAISLALAFVFVLGMNRGLLAAARNIRRSASRAEPASRVDLAVLWTVALVEALSVGYMFWLLEQPTSLIQWLLIIARAAFVPPIAVYLEVQVAHPIDPRDIAVEAATGAGLGMLQDYVAIANDHTVPLATKTQLYSAAAAPTAEQAQHLAAMQAAASAYQPVQLLGADGEPLRTVATNVPPKPPAPSRKRTAPAEAKRATRLERLRAALADGESLTVRAVARRFRVSVGTAQADLQAARGKSAA